MAESSEPEVVATGHDAGALVQVVRQSGRWWLCLAMPDWSLDIVLAAPAVVAELRDFLRPPAGGEAAATFNAGSLLGEAVRVSKHAGPRACLVVATTGEGGSVRLDVPGGLSASLANAVAEAAEELSRRAEPGAAADPAS